MPLKLLGGRGQGAIGVYTGHLELSLAQIPIDAFIAIASSLCCQLGYFDISY